MFKLGYIISIGAGKNQLPFILKCKELGLKVIAIDQNPQAPGFLHSEIKIFLSVLEYRKIYAFLLKLILDEPILGIGVRSYGNAVLTASYLAKKFDLISTDVEVLAKFYNKKTMKAFLGDNKVLVPKAYSWQNGRGIVKFIQTISYPCILKPVNNIAKLGIEVFDNENSLMPRISEIKSKSEQFLLEDYIVGEEVTVIGFVQNGKFQLVSLSDKVTTNYPPYIELSHQVPSKQIKYVGEIKLICQNIVDVTQLKNSPIVAEFKITNQGEIYLMEIMPEVGGEYLADYLIPEFYNYDYFRNYISLLTGFAILPVDYKKTKEKEILSQICFISPPEGKSRLAYYSQVSSADGKIYLNENLKQIGDSLNTKQGNACRVKVIGISHPRIKNPVELDSLIRKNVNAKFE
ncbi:MAG: ATP-grasp domain-containing protein [Leptospiraceae bacterium]|nr:ATP-grasp domain-containing protein [Leptospiraceae bacterium]